MDLEASKMENSRRQAWARTGALILFLVTGILLLASLNTAKSQQSQLHTPLSAQQVARN